MPARARMLSAALAVAAAAAALPGVAAGATMRTDRRCYTHNQKLRIGGGGFQPGSRQSIFLDGQFLGALTPNARGAIGGRPILAPEPASSPTATRRYTLTASSSRSGTPVTARTSFSVVHTTIKLTPQFVTPGDVTYSARGFTWGQTLYVHYLRRGRVVASRRVDRLRGACGTLRKKVRMFLFRPVKPGTYRFVFSNSRRSATFRPNAFFDATVLTTFH